MRSLLTKNNQKLLKKTNLAIAELTEEAAQIEVHNKAYFLSMLTEDPEEHTKNNERSESEIADPFEVDLFAAQ
jgi:hypothetical protein